ncbi:MAG: hypothetical protein JXA10_16390 [Anaerolineae bacterium]|nr:hypothetical protein [Anaerolineae bacterium]
MVPVQMRRGLAASHGVLMIVILLIVVGCSSEKSASDQLLPTVTPPETPLRIMVVHSFGPELSWVHQINQGIAHEFAQYGYSSANGNLELKFYYMNAQRAATEGELIRMGNGARAYIARDTFDLIFAVDDAAVSQVIALTPPGQTPYVFLGLDARPKDYGLEDRDDVAGVMERLHIDETFSWLRRVNPNTQRITLLADNSSLPTGFGTNVRAALDASIFAHSPIYIVETIADWQAMVKLASATSDFLVVGSYFSLVDAEGSPVIQSDVIAWTLENSKIPVVGFWEYTIQEGALGGSVISGETQAQFAVDKAIRILNGEAPSAVGFDAPERGKLMLNKTAMSRWDMTIPLDLIEISTLVE